MCSGKTSKSLCPSSEPIPLVKLYISFNFQYLLPRESTFSFCQVKLTNKPPILLLKNSLLGYTEQYLEYDPFLTPPDPSNPWISDDTTLWELEARWVRKTTNAKRYSLVFLQHILICEIVLYFLCPPPVRSQASRG